MKKNKVIILTVTISFPVLLYLFLRFFGQNNYDLPIYFNKVGNNCSDSIIFYAPNDISTELSDFGTYLPAGYKIILFPSTDRDNQSLKNELSRLQSSFNKRDIDLNYIIIEPLAHAGEPFEMSLSDMQKIFVDDEALDLLWNCELQLPNSDYAGKHPVDEEWPSEEIIVLLDKQNLIRGYYNGFETQEVDRLILEINVLLSNKGDGK